MSLDFDIRLPWIAKLGWTLACMLCHLPGTGTEVDGSIMGWRWGTLWTDTQTENTPFPSFRRKVDWECTEPVHWHTTDYIQNKC